MRTNIVHIVSTANHHGKSLNWTQPIGSSEKFVIGAEMRAGALRSASSASAMRPRRFEKRVPILIVDDDPDVLGSLKGVLELFQDYDVKTAADAATALDIMHEFRPHVALIDVKLHKESGLDLIAELKQRDPVVMCVAMTAYRSLDYAAAAVRSGADDYLLKPLDPSNLDQVLHQYVERRHLMRQRLNADRRYWAIFEQTFQLLLLAERDGTVLEINETARAFTGIERPSTGQWLWEILRGDGNDKKSSAELQQQLRDCVSKVGRGLSVRDELRLVDCVGAQRILDVSMKPVLDERQQATHIIIEARDVTDSRSRELALQESEERFRGAFDHAAIPMVLAGLDGQFTKVNTAMCELLGYAEPELLNMGWWDITHDDERQAAANCFDKLIAGEQDTYSTRTQFVNKTQEDLWVDLHVSAVRDEAGSFRNLIAQIQNVTEAKQLSEQLIHQANHDDLTGLVNRAEFERRLSRILEKQREDGTTHALAYLDLDQFKIINDTCGHIAGDELLKQLAPQLQAEVRQRDTLARLGGDEFGILLEHCTLDQAHRAVEALRHAVTEMKFVWEGKNFNIGVSIGLVPVTPTSGDKTELLKQADAACYAAKERGRGRIHVYLEDDAALVQRQGEMRWVGRINGALDEDRFRLCAQPIVPLNREPIGLHYELLLRMEESGTLVVPGAFLPAAERYGLAVRTDRWVVKTALRWLAANPEHLQDLALCSINLSGHSMGDDDFLQFVFDQFAATAVPAEKICFEVTETAAIANLARASQFMAKLKQRGCLFALDDFGSGLSSFAYLKSLPVDILKIDGAFVRDVNGDDVDLEMVRAINEIGHVLGKQTVAEFVEDVHILETVRTMGVDFAQGFGVGHPELIDLGSL